VEVYLNTTDGSNYLQRVDFLVIDAQNITINLTNATNVISDATLALAIVSQGSNVYDIELQVIGTAIPLPMLQDSADFKRRASTIESIIRAPGSNIRLSAADYDSIYATITISANETASVPCSFLAAATTATELACSIPASIFGPAVGRVRLVASIIGDVVISSNSDTMIVPPPSLDSSSTFRKVFHNEGRGNVTITGQNLPIYLTDYSNITMSVSGETHTCVPDPSSDATKLICPLSGVFWQNEGVMTLEASAFGVHIGPINPPIAFVGVHVHSTSTYEYAVSARAIRIMMDFAGTGEETRVVHVNGASVNSTYVSETEIAVDVTNLVTANVWSLGSILNASVTIANTTGPLSHVDIGFVGPDPTITSTMYPVYISDVEGELQLIGTNIDLTAGSRVEVSGQHCINASSLSRDRLVCIAPAISTGVYDLRVLTKGDYEILMPAFVAFQTATRTLVQFESEFPVGAGNITSMYDILVDSFELPASDWEIYDPTTFSPSASAFGVVHERRSTATTIRYLTFSPASTPALNVTLQDTRFFAVVGQAVRAGAPAASNLLVGAVEPFSAPSSAFVPTVLLDSVPFIAPLDSLSVPSQALPDAAISGIICAAVLVALILVVLVYLVVRRSLDNTKKNASISARVSSAEFAKKSNSAGGGSGAATSSEMMPEESDSEEVRSYQDDSDEDDSFASEDVDDEEDGEEEDYTEDELR
jgi:hypothetical protein